MDVTIPIVNERDEIIGHKKRSDINYAKDIFRTASLWITDAEGRILLAQRSSDKKVDPDKWAEAVGGTVEADDSYETTIYREAQEELGIIGEKFERGPKQFVDTPFARYFIQWYIITLDWPLEDFHPQTSELQAIGWWSKDQLRNIHERIEEGQFTEAILPMLNSVN